MKNKIISIIQALVLLWGVTSCHSPEELGSDIQREGINSITASFPNDDSSENSFKGEIDYTNHSITFVFPYNYPKLSDNVLPTSALKRVRLSASLANNVSVTPPLLYMDLTQDNYITVKDQTSGTSIEFKVIGEIRKSNECSITKFDIPAIGLLGVINENEKTISLVTIDNVGEQIANIDISHGATCNPNPETEALDYEQEQTIVVTAQNGIDKATYTVKKDIPQKTVAGIRQGSGKLLWSKRLSEISGILLPGKVTGLAVVDKYVVINERANDRAIYLNSQTGEIAGSMDISQFAGDNSNFHATADRGNNILFCSYTPSGGTFTVWKANGVNEKPQKYIEYKTGTNIRFGWKISIQGDLDANALITTPVFQKDSKVQFARWRVINGTLQSQSPEFVIMSSSLLTSNWIKWADVIYADDTDTQSDYFLASHVTDTSAKRYFYWFKGTDNSIKAANTGAPGNTIINAVDYAVFNKVPYVIYNQVNSFNYAVTGSDAVRMYDLSSGSFDNQIVVCPDKIYGGLENSGQNTEGTGDVVFKAAKNGYYLYVYLVFSNGGIACYQYDCIDM